MSALRRMQEQTNLIDVSATSDDGLITVRATGTGEIQVQLRDGALRGVREAELQRRINAVIDEAMWQLRIAYRQVSTHTLGID